MNKLLLLIATAAGALLASCTPAVRVVENPLIDAANTRTLDIVKIELSDTATILHVDAYFRPRNWIRIDAGTYLQADGERYAIRGGEGIQLDSLFWMPDSGEASFVLKFGPLPRGTKTFDFIESDCDDCFKLYGVDLTGKKEYSPYPEGLPRELRKAPKDAAVPDPILEVGETTVNIHLLGFREGMYKEVALYVNSLLTGQDGHTAQIDPKTGIATFRFEQYGSAKAFAASSGSMIGQFWIAPGETMDLYVDLRTTGKAIVQRRNKDLKQIESDGRKLYSTGTYGDLNMLFDQAVDGFIGLDCYSGRFADYRMGADEYMQLVESQYRKLADSIARSDLPDMIKELNLLTLQQQTLGAVGNARHIFEVNYREANNLWDRNVKIDLEFATLKPEHYVAASKLFDIANPKLLMGIALMDYGAAIIHSDADWAGILQVSDGIIVDLRKIAALPPKAANNELTEEDFALLRSLKNPFYAQACEALQARVRRELEAVKDVRIEQAPDVSLDKLFDAIVAPYKGKVVFVDFWNTWCGPCQASIKANEPLKSGELKSDDLVWIYIANETSPIVKYKTDIARIQGLHYRLSDEQWAYLCEKFDIDGIPSYVVVSKDGSYKLRNDLRDHDLLTKTLKKMIE